LNIPGKGSVECVPYVSSALFLEELPGPGEIWVPASFPAAVGDTVTLEMYGGKPVEVTIGAKTDAYHYKEVTRDRIDGIIHTVSYDILIAEDVYCRAFGTDEISYSDTVYVIAKPDKWTDEDAVLTAIEQAAGYSRSYINEYDRRLHDTFDRTFTIVNVYRESQITAVRDAFIYLFLFVQLAYLLGCAAAVVVSVTDFQLSVRNREFSILRALGLEKDTIQSIGRRYSTLAFNWIMPLLYPVMVALAVYMDDQVGWIYNEITRERTFEGYKVLMLYIAGYLVTSLVLFVLYHFSARLSARRSMQRILHVPLAESVKQDG